MERVASKLVQWKAIYDALEAAQMALLVALRSDANDEDVDALRLDVDRLHVRSEAALKELDEQVARFRRSRTPHH
jgi:hypothetical protein